MTQHQKNCDLCAQYVADINSQVGSWYFETGVWPVDLMRIGADPRYFPDGVPICPVGNESYVLDADTHRVAGH